MGWVTPRMVGALATAVCVIAPAGQASASPPGALDTTLGGAGFATVPVGSWGGAAAVRVQPDGKIVTAGEAAVQGRAMMISTRMLPDGSLDRGYGNAGLVTVDIDGSAGANALALQRNGRIVLGGTGRANRRLGFAAVRLMPNGSLDSSFGRGGIATVTIGSQAIANAVAIRPDGKIILGGMSLGGHNEFAAAQLNRDGSIDSGFGTSGVVRLPPVAAAWGMALQHDGNIVLVGQMNAPPSPNLLGNLFQFLGNSQMYIAARLKPNGALDPAFGSGGIVRVRIGSNAIANAIALQPDGKIVLGGSAVMSGPVAATVRLMPDGSLDRSFGNGGIATLPLAQVINATALQRDGKIVLAGPGATAVRLNPDGSPDQSFGNHGVIRARIGTSDAANGVTIQPDGKIVLAGVATINSRIVLAVIRLKS